MTDAQKAPVIKEIEQFSRDVCHQLGTERGEQYRRTEVIYGLAAFMSSVVHAVQQQSNRQFEKGSMK